MNRLEWQQLADEKLLAADSLLAARQWSSAYYLAGYAVEFGLKSCILARIAGFPEVIFEGGTGRAFSKDCWTHEIDVLVRLAGLESSHKTAITTAPLLARSWQLVRQWSEETRYEEKTEPEARQLYDAIADPVHGVMQWIKVRW